LAAREKQPKGLYLLCFTEAWERFGFYTIQTIFVLYLSQGLDFTDQFSYLLYGAFSSLLYLTPVVGGYIADRYMGFQRAILLGGVLFTIGYALTSIPGSWGFFLGLSFVILGNGFFKPNVSSIVGDLYGPDDPRRDGGFTLFYMGINIGAMIPPIFAGAVVKYWGWDSGFLLAAIGMFIGLLSFYFGRSRLKHCGMVPEQSPLRDKKFHWKFNILLYVGIIISIGIVYLLLQFPRETNWILIAGSAVIILIVLYFLLKQKKRARQKMIAALVLILISVGFWAIYNQTFTSLMLYAQRNMEKTFLGIPIDAEFTQFFNPFFIIILSPFLSKLWIGLERKRLNPSTPMKFSLGVLFVALGFFFLAFGTKYFGDPNGQTSAWWLAMSYLIQTIGELLLSPIGLAMITRLSPKDLVGMMMGVWFLTQAAAFAIGGELATIYDVAKGIGAVQSLPIYTEAFLIYGSMAALLAIISFALSPYLNRLISGEKESI